MANKYNWVDDPCISGKSPCDTDVLNENLMHIKYDVTDEIQKKADDAINEVVNAVAVQRIYDCGISTDTKGFEIVKELAHSTFDKSKFTIQGSPTITDDGIASGFSSNNRVETITLDTSKKNYHVKLSGIEYRGQQSFVFGNRNISKSQSLNLIFDVNKIALFVSSTGDSWDIANYPSSSFIFEVNKVYDISFIREGGNTYKVIVFDHSLNQEFTIITISSELDIYNSPNKICIGSGSWEAYSGSIDLKQFSITVDDIPVFNGNKTGLYVAKPDNYTVEGSPTITDDGILTNCPSQNDYLSATIPSLSQFEKVRIEFELKVKEVPSSTRGIFNIPNDENPTTANSGTYAWLNSVGFNINLAYNGDSDNGTGSTAKYPIAIGDFIKVIAEGNKNSVGSIKVSKNNGVFNDLTLTQSNACNFQEATKLFLGITGVGRQMQSSAEFDINSFKIYGDGNLIYQPCLKIPYTEAFEHSKVVGVAYRNRVQDLYEQTGEALFYTLDEQNQNFTLPMGDIYGMITENREILDIVYPIGRPMPEENNVLLDNEVWLEGATVNIVDYPKLFEVYGTKYGGDGITTFGLPDMRGRTLWGSPDASNGYIEAKLPNIKGSCGKFDVYEAGGEGCFNISSQTYGNTREQWGGSVAAIGFDASRSSSIYSDDATTVQPPAFKVRWKTRFE